MNRCWLWLAGALLALLLAVPAEAAGPAAPAPPAGSEPLEKLSFAVVIGNNAQIEPKAAELVSIAGACAGAATCQFRLRFTRDTEAPGDGEFDYVTISSAESSVASRRPTLRLTWETP